MSRHQSGSPTPSVDDLVAAVTRSADAKAEADRLRPPDDAMTIPSPDSQIRWMMAALAALLLLVSGGIAGVGWWLQGEVMAATTREIGAPPPPEPFAALLLADDMAVKHLIGDHPRRTAEILAGRAQALFAKGRIEESLDALAMLEVRGPLAAQEVFLRARALAQIGHIHDALAVCRSLDAGMLSDPDRARLAALVERLLLGRPGKAGDEEHLDPGLAAPAILGATEAVQALDPVGGTDRGHHQATNAHQIE